MLNNSSLGKHKVLIISYYWPPAGGPGVQRWLKFVKYLPEFGVIPHVYVPENPSYPIIDSNIEQQLSDEVVVIKRKIFEPYQIAAIFGRKKTQKISAGLITNPKNQTFIEKVLLWIRGNLFIPDARVFWVRSSVAFLKEYVCEHQINTIITTGPPHSLHLIGLKLKQNNNSLKWIADFRDPWTTISYHKSLRLSHFANKKHKLLEAKILQVADDIIVTSPTTKIEFTSITQKPIHVITNGFDIDANILANDVDKMFSIAHIGSLLSERNPIFLWEILNELKKEIDAFSDDFQLKLVGKVSDEVLNSIQQFGLEINLNNIGYLSHIQSIKEQKKSQVLLLIEINNENTTCIIPGKIFEYIVSGRPIVALGPKGSDIKNIIEDSQTGIFVDYSEKQVLKTHLIALYRQFKNENLAVVAKNVAQYSRRNLTSKLADIILR